MKPRVPNCFLVGAPKCGTTALARFLSQHSHVFFSEPKEPGYFIVDERHGDVTVPDFEAYRRLFEQAKTEKVVAEGTTSYLMYPSALARIAALAPEARIIVCLREPVASMVSLHLQLCRNRESEFITDFEEALAAEPDREQGRRLPRRHRDNPELFQYRKRVRYADQLETVYRYFGRDQVQVILHDDLVESNAVVFRKLEAFLDIPHEEVEFGSHNTATVPRYPRFRDLTSRFLQSGMWTRIRTRVLPLAPKSAVRRWKRHVYAEEPVDRSEPALSPKAGEDLKRELLPQVRKLSDLLGEDLVARWGYPNASGAIDPVSGRNDPAGKQ